MDDSHRPSPSSSAAVGKQCRRLRRHVVEEDGDPAVACTGRSCRSCAAGAIADCVAVCCCPCAVVNLMALAFVKLPWAVARRCLGGRWKRNRRRRLEEKRKCREGDVGVISGKGKAEDGTTSSDIVLTGAVIGEELNDHFSAQFKAENIWLDVGHLGFGRVSSFNGIPFQNKGN